jgi:hypothetical protein
MVTAKQQKSIDLYQALMSEARYRIDLFNFILPGGTKLPEALVQELCYLQLRMLCETIALGCLVAHGDIIQLQIKQFEKEWSAEKIIEKLERLNPDFFPQQMVLGRGPQGGSITANTNPNALKKDELTKLWNKCGGFLHRGTLKKLDSFDPQKHGKVNVADITESVQKIEDLLGSHLIPLFATEDGAALMICVLRDSAKNLATTVQRVELTRRSPPVQ